MITCKGSTQFLQSTPGRACQPTPGQCQKPLCYSRQNGIFRRRSDSGKAASTASNESEQSCKPQIFYGLRRKNCWQRRDVSMAGGSAAPSSPWPGDGRSGYMYTALAEIEAEIEEHASNNAALTAPNGASVAEGGVPPEEPKNGMSHRWRVVAMMAVSFVLCNMDKVNMSVAVIPMAHELGWSATDRGLVSSAFFWGYSLTQIPAGWVSTKVGGAKVLLVGVALWSLGTLLAPPAANYSLLALCASRVFVGLGEGLAPSSATNVMARQIPEGERARAVTTVFGGLDVGSAFGLILCGPLIQAFGWPSVFYLFAAMGLVWCLLWPLLSPEKQDPIMANSTQHYTNNSNGTQKSVPWGLFLRSGPVWAVIIAHFCYNWGYYTLLAWLPSYFELALGLNVRSSSLLTLIPYIAMTAMTPLVGPVADNLVSRGWDITNIRKLAQGISFAGPAVCMLACAVLTPGGAFHVQATAVVGSVTVIIVGILSVAFALGAWARAGLYCNHQDLSPRYAGALLGISNTAGALPGILGVSLAGYLLDQTNSWALALFYPTAICQVLGLIVYSLFASSKRQGWD